MNIWGCILKLAGWSVEITVPSVDKCVICVAPHTSNLDFLLGLLAYRSVGRKANFLMKKFWFFFPLNIILKSLGGIPVDRSSKSKKSGSLTEHLIHRFKESEYMNLAVTPEGTRSPQANWKTGFLYIAIGADVPVFLGLIDYQHKNIIIKDEFKPTGDIEKDMSAIKKYYSSFKNAAKFPEKFLTS